MKKPIIIVLLLFIVLISTLINVTHTKYKEQSHNKNDSVSSANELNNADKSKKDHDIEFNYFREHNKKPFVNYIQTTSSTTSKKLPSRHLKGKIIYMSQSNNLAN